MLVHCAVRRSLILAVAEIKVVVRVVLIIQAAQIGLEALFERGRPQFRRGQTESGRVLRRNCDRISSILGLVLGAGKIEELIFLDRPANVSGEDPPLLERLRKREGRARNQAGAAFEHQHFAVSVIGAASGGHADDAAYGSAVFRVHIVGEHLDFGNVFRREDAKASGTAALGVIDAVHDVAFALHAAESVSRVAELVVGCAVVARPIKAQVECVTGRDRQVFDRPGIHRLAHIEGLRIQNNGVAFNGHGLLRGADLER